MYCSKCEQKDLYPYIGCGLGVKLSYECVDGVVKTRPEDMSECAEARINEANAKNYCKNR